jgi:hypothetical protein
LSNTEAFVRTFSAIVIVGIGIVVASAVHAEDGPQRMSSDPRVAVVIPEGAGADRIRQLLGAELLRVYLPWEEVLRQNAHLTTGLHPGTEVAATLPSPAQLHALEEQIAVLEAAARAQNAQISDRTREISDLRAMVTQEREHAEHAEGELLRWKWQSFVLPVIAAVLVATYFFLRYRSRSRQFRNVVAEKEKLEARVQRAEQAARLAVAKLQLRVNELYRKVVPQGGRTDVLMLLMRELEQKPIDLPPSNGTTHAPVPTEQLAPTTHA